MRAFVVLGLVFSVPSQEIGLGKRLRNDPLCVELDVKPQLIQSLSLCQLQPRALRTWPSRSRCHFGCGLVGTLAARWGPGSPDGKGHLSVFLSMPRIAIDRYV